MSYNFASRILASSTNTSIHHVLNKAGLAAEQHDDEFRIDADPEDVKRAIQALKDAGAKVEKKGKDYYVTLGNEVASIVEV